MIYEATAEHLKEVVDLGQAYFDASRFAQFQEYNPTQGHNYFRTAIISPMCKADVLVIDNLTVGFCVTLAGPQGWSSNLAANVNLLFILEEYRGQGWERVFVERAEQWATENKMDEILLGDYGMTPERTRILTERMGYETVGYIGCKRLNVEKAA